MKWVIILLGMTLTASGQVSYFSSTLLRQPNAELWRFYLGVFGTNVSQGITNLNGLSSQTQTLSVGTGGLDFNISSAVTDHQFNLPTADATHRGALSSADWSSFTAKAGMSDVLNASNVLRADITTLQGATNGLNADVLNLQGATNGLNTRMANVEGATNGLTTRVNNLDGATNSLNTRVTNLEGVSNALGSAAFQSKDAFQPAHTGLTNITLQPVADGILVRTSTNNYTTRTITGSSGAVIANGDGVAGNPAISVAMGLQDLTNVVASGPADGEMLSWNDTMKKWTNVAGGVGTVTSVALSSVDSLFAISGSPVTTSGTLGFTLTNEFLTNWAKMPTNIYATTTYVDSSVNNASNVLAAEKISIQSGNGNANTFTNATIQTALTVSNITASRAAVFNSSKQLTNSTVTQAELDFVSGVTSAIQTQLDGKQPGNAALTNLAGTRAVTNITRTVITTTGVSIYTVPSGVKYIFVECVGGGAGGGAVDGAANQSAAGGGGGSGAYCSTNITTPAASYIVTVGTNGPGGVTPSGTGSVGGQTTFTNLMTAPGGNGGIGKASAAAASITLGGSGATVATGGTVSTGGTSGGNGICVSATLAISGQGAGSIYGGGGAAQTAAVGGAATGYGAGGGGAAVITNTDRAGGAGSQGIIIITEYYQ